MHCWKPGMWEGYNLSIKDDRKWLPVLYQGVAPGARTNCTKLCWASLQIFKLRWPVTFLFGPTDQEQQQTKMLEVWYRTWKIGMYNWWVRISHINFDSLVSSWRDQITRLLESRGYRGVQGDTRGYRRLKGVKSGFRGLKRVTRGWRVTGGYKGLQEVASSYMGLQGLRGVTKGYNRFQGLTGGYKGLQAVKRG